MAPMPVPGTSAGEAGACSKSTISSQP